MVISALTDMETSQGRAGHFLSSHRAAKARAGVQAQPGFRKALCLWVLVGGTIQRQSPSSGPATCQSPSKHVGLTGPEDKGSGARAQRGKAGRPESQHALPPALWIAQTVDASKDADPCNCV